MTIAPKNGFEQSSQSVLQNPNKADRKNELPKSDQKSFRVLNRLKYTGFKRFKAGMIWDYKLLLDVL